MKLKLALAALLLVTLAQAEMESLQCTVFENQSANASDSALCHEYVLQGDDLLFHLRAKDVRRPVLLPVGKEVGYRMEEDRFYLRLAASDKKEHEYLVLSIEPREKSEARVQTALKVNHLQ